MLLRDQKADVGFIPAWPPRWTIPNVTRAAPLPLVHDGVLAAAARVPGSGEIGVTMTFAGDTYTGCLAWSGAPMSSAVERVLHANVGYPITTLGSLTLL